MKTNFDTFPNSNSVNESIKGMQSFYIDYAKAVLKNTRFKNQIDSYDLDYLTRLLNHAAQDGYEEAYNLLNEIDLYLSQSYAEEG